AAPQGIRGNMAVGPAGVAPALPQPIQLLTDAGTLWDNYAKAMYISSVFAGRRGSIEGKLRLDIAPGSTIEVIIDEEKWVAQSLGQLPFQSIYALVVGVTVFL